MPENQTIPPELIAAMERNGEVCTSVLETARSIEKMIKEQLRPGEIQSGRKAVASAGTAERLFPSPMPVKWVLFFAPGGNANNIIIGGANVVATVGSENGIVLSALGMTQQLHNVDLYTFYINALNNNDGVAFIYAK